MENTAILREWFDRVDSEKKGSITASQLKVLFLYSIFLFSFLVFRVYNSLNEKYDECFKGRFHSDNRKIFVIRVRLQSETWNFLYPWSSRWSECTITTEMEL